MEAVPVVTLGVVAVAAVIDLRTQRIPNVLTFGATGAALAFHAWTGGVEGFGSSVAGWAVGVAVFLPLFLLRGMGAGDVKLLGAVGAWQGPIGALWAAIFSVGAGGVLGLLVSLSRGYTMQALANLWGLLNFWRVAGIRPMPGLTMHDTRGPRLAYAVAIAAGTLVSVWLK